MLNINIHITS